VIERRRRPGARPHEHGIASGGGAQERHPGGARGQERGLEAIASDRRSALMRGPLIRRPLISWSRHRGAGGIRGPVVVAACIQHDDARSGMSVCSDHTRPDLRSERGDVWPGRRGGRGGRDLSLLTLQCLDPHRIGRHERGRVLIPRAPDSHARGEQEQARGQAGPAQRISHSRSYPLRRLHPRRPGREVTGHRKTSGRPRSPNEDIVHGAKLLEDGNPLPAGARPE
jgi:hypothetical protein